MSSFTIEATCRTCGGHLDYVTGSPSRLRPRTETVWVLRCRENGHHLFVLRAELLKAPVDARVAERQRHEGTSTGWRVRKAERLRQQGAGHPQEPGRKVAS